MGWTTRNPLVGNQRISEVSDTQKHPLGTIVNAIDPLYGEGEFIYLKGVASCVEGSWVTYNTDDWSTALLAANAIGPVAVSMGALVANTFGWFQIQGKAVGKALAGYADNANVYGTATAGSVDDAIVAGDRVQNAKGASALGTIVSGNGTSVTNAAEFEIWRPFVNDALAD